MTANCPKTDTSTGSSKTAPQSAANETSKVLSLLNQQESNKKKAFTSGRTSRPGLDDFFDFKEVEHEDQVGFAVYYPSPNEDKLEFVSYYGEEFESGVKFIPKSKDEIPWLLPSYPEEYGSENSLYSEVRQFIYLHLDLSLEWQYDVLTAWILAQWRQEEWTSCPYICVMGPKNSGKSRVEEVLQQLSYRGIFSPSMSNATLFHAIERTTSQSSLTKQNSSSTAKKRTNCFPSSTTAIEKAAKSTDTTWTKRPTSSSSFTASKSSLQQGS